VGTNVDIVRSYYAALDSVLERYWAAPDTRISDAPFTEDVLVLLHPDFEWDAMHREEPYRGREGALQGAEDWLEPAEEWRVEVEELTDAGEDRVLAVLRVYIRGRGSGVPIDQRIFAIARVADGKIRGIADFTERRDALAAAGLAPG
jgi:ketosteroid isomerase-like protein